MKNIAAVLILSAFTLFFVSSFAQASLPAAVKNTAAVTFVSSKDCGKGQSFFGIPPWYKYLKFDIEKNCELVLKVDENNNGVIDSNEGIDFKVVWLILLAVVEALLVISGFVAFVYVIVGGVKFITAQGAPDKIAGARKTIVNALIGAVIAILGSQVVAFIAGSLT